MILLIVLWPCSASAARLASNSGVNVAAAHWWEPSLTGDAPLQRLTMGAGLPKCMKQVVAPGIVTPPQRQHFLDVVGQLA